MSSDYTRIGQALEYLATHVDEQPGLDEVAAELGLSPHHLQRLFTRWVGVSPKKFLQYLTLERAKAALVAHSSVLDASLAAGLSGPGRLHDLFVTHEAVTPGEYKARGAGLTIDYGWAPSPFGDALAFLTPRGLCGLAFAFSNTNGRQEAFEDMRRRWPKATIQENKTRAAETVESIFGDAAPRNGREKLKLVLHGSPFQIKVWEALLHIPQGGLVTYDAIARKVGSPTGARAVGGAVGANPISWLIPCHRVIRKVALGGDYNWVGGYNWGPTRKLAMLGWEAAHTDPETLRAAS
jgi:AraC family transcriptional regulator, regulatory protein of adaptative response / methylated-DNA-[protein]-cysteine methyltransferase